MEQVPQLYPCVLQGVWVVTPVGPVSRYWRKNGVHRGDLSQILKNLGQVSSVNSILPPIATNWANWSHDPDALENARVQLGHLLHQLSPP